MFGRNISNKKKPAIICLSENQNLLNNKLSERSYILEISIEETYEGKLLTN